jgi:hypothetical protein
MRTTTASRATAASAWILAGLASLAVAGAQAPGGTPPDLGGQLRERYDIVALNQGVALVPRQSGDIRMIQILDGVVSIDGEIVTGRQLRDRLGDDAEFVLQASYLNADAQRQLAGAGSAASGDQASLPPSQQSPDVERTEVRNGDIIRFGGDVRIEENERVQGDVVVMGGSASVDGEISGDLTVIGGTARLGPQSVIRRDLNVIGGRLDRAPGALVVGELNEVGTGGGGVGLRGGDGTLGDWGFRESGLSRFWSRMGSLAGTVLRLGLVALVALVAVAFGSRQVERIAARAAVNPLRAGLVGFAAEVLFTPVLVLTIIVLVVSIIGIPLLALIPFAVLLLLIVMLVGFVGLSYSVGQVILAKFGRAGASRYLTVAVGVVAVGGLTLLAKLAALAGGDLFGVPLVVLGYFVEYVAWTVGFGAAVLAWYESQRLFGSSGHAMSSPAPAAGDIS